MSLALLADAQLLLPLLLDHDRKVALEVRASGCPCGGPLYVANFARRPRGVPVRGPEGFELRFSFCCGREGCRRRVTPPSVRFLGPKVYLGATVLLVSALRHGSTPA